MLFSSRKTIGLFITKSFVYFDDACFHILEEEGKRLNYDIAVFATVGYRLSKNQYDIQEKNLFAFAPVENLDGILIVPDSYERGEFRDLLYEMLRQRASCPIVAIRHDGAEYDCTSTDESGSIQLIVRHLIQHHGLKKICFQTGFPGHAECELRLKAFRQEMENNGLPVPENAVCPGTMWTDCGDTAYEAFFSDPENRPEAVVCGNDYMAVGLIRTLLKHGIRVPEDVIVTGFDNMPALGLDVPSLTTIQPDYQTMVKDAIRLLDLKIKHQETEEKKQMFIPGTLVLGESCGCCKRTSEYLLRTSRDMMAELELRNMQVLQMNSLCINISACDHLEELHQVLIEKKTDTPVLQDYYLCLFGGPKQWSQQIRDQACLVHAMRDRQDWGMPMVPFPTRNLLPPMCDRPEEAQMLYVKLLHQQGNIFGYGVFRYQPGQTPSRHFVQWNVLISSALNNIYKREELQALYEERRLSSITDPLTGLLNRRGFEEKLVPIWHRLQGKQVSFINIDLDRLKRINDHYGHGAGDFSIRLVGRAIMETVPGNGFSARVGGDEYIVFLEGDQAEQYIASFTERLAELNRQENRSFCVTASAGGVSILVNEDTTIEQCLKQGDEAMYRAKEISRTR